MRVRKQLMWSLARRSALRRSAVLAGALAGAVALAPAYPAPARAGETSVGMPNERVRSILRRHSLKTLDGKSVSLEALQGEVVVVNFWASWCSPCRRELPALDRLHQEIARRGGRVIAVSIDEDVANVHRFASRHGLALPIVHDGPDGLARELDLKHVPFTIVLDRTGDVAFTTHGSDRAALDALTASTRQLIAGHPAAQAEGGGRP